VDHCFGGFGNSGSVRRTPRCSPTTFSTRKRAAGKCSSAVRRSSGRRPPSFALGAGQALQRRGVRLATHPGLLGNELALGEYLAHDA
jgi:hypothetical protein